MLHSLNPSWSMIMIGSLWYFQHWGHLVTGISVQWLFPLLVVEFSWFLRCLVILDTSNIMSLWCCLYRIENALLFCFTVHLTQLGSGHRIQLSFFCGLGSEVSPVFKASVALFGSFLAIYCVGLYPEAWLVVLLPSVVFKAFDMLFRVRSTCYTLGMSLGIRVQLYGVNFYRSLLCKFHQYCGTQPWPHFADPLSGRPRPCYPSFAMAFPQLSLSQGPRE